MPKSKTIVEISHAEAWVNMMPVQPTSGGMLHVIALLKIIQHPGGGKMLLQKRIPQGLNPSILILDVIQSNLEIYLYNPQHLAYAENLKSSKQYTSIEIYFNDKKIGTIKEIPIVQ